MFCRGYELPQTETVSLLSERDEKNKSWTMLTLFENGVIKFQHDETRLKSLQWGKQMTPLQNG